MINSSIGDFPQMFSSAYGSSTLDFSQAIAHQLEDTFQQQYQQPTTETSKTAMPNPSRRFVQVFISDTNENVPLEKSMLFVGEQKLTDLNDQELFFEIPLAEKLKLHNEMRVKCIDKDPTKKSGKEVFLEPAKIRDLKMVVVTIAQF